MKISACGPAACALMAFAVFSVAPRDASAQHTPRATRARARTEATLDAPHATSNNRAILRAVEQHAAGGARRVLAAARAMIERSVLVRGSCATWLGAVYRRAGGRFETVFVRAHRGAYAAPTQLRPGDWMRFVNHSFHGVGHSAMFIGWADAAHTRALTVSYVGQRRVEPGRFHVYDVRHVYQIDRMRD